MSGKNLPIGVLDSGVGGLSVLKCLKGMLPAEDFIYIGDTARTPYGSRPESEVRAFTEEMLSFLERQGVKLVVVACNTITVLGVDSLKQQHRFPIVGMSRGAGLLLKATKNKKIGVFATEFTIGTGVHKAAILAADPTAMVTPVPCPKFVPLVEGEALGSEAVTEAVAEYAAVVKKAGCDAVILSCTHYPFLKNEIAKDLGAQVTIIDPAEETAEAAKEILRSQGLLQEARQGTATLCFTADVERGKRLASRMLSEAGCDYRLVKLTL